MPEIKNNYHKKILRSGEVAEHFDVSPRTIYNWRNLGIIKGFKMGGTLFFTVEEIEAAIAEQQKKTDE